MIKNTPAQCNVLIMLSLQCWKKVLLNWRKWNITNIGQAEKNTIWESRQANTLSEPSVAPEHTMNLSHMNAWARSHCIQFVSFATTTAKRDNIAALSNCNICMSPNRFGKGNVAIFWMKRNHSWTKHTTELQLHFLLKTWFRHNQSWWSHFLVNSSFFCPKVWEITSDSCSPAHQWDWPVLTIVRESMIASKTKMLSLVSSACGHVVVRLNTQSSGYHSVFWSTSVVCVWGKHGKWCSALHQCWMLTHRTQNEGSVTGMRLFNNSPGGALQPEWGSSTRAPPAREQRSHEGCNAPKGSVMTVASRWQHVERVCCTLRVLLPWNSSNCSVKITATVYPPRQGVPERFAEQVQGAVNLYSGLSRRGLNVPRCVGLHTVHKRSAVATSHLRKIKLCRA